MRFPSTLDEGTRKSKPFPEVTNTDPKDLGGNIHPTDKGLPFTISDEGAAKTTSLPEGPHGDKDSEELKPLTDMEPHTNPIVDPLGTDANDDEEVFAAKEDMDEDTQADEEWEKYEEAAVSYADLRASIKGYYKENSPKLSVIQDAVKDDSTLNKKVIEAEIRSELFCLKQDTSDIKSMMTKIYQAFKGQSSTLSSSVPQTTLVITKEPITIWRGENVTLVVTEKPPFHTEGETKDMKTQDTNKEKVEKEQVSEEPKHVVPISTAKPTENFNT
uniref:Uncharacterized protein n=1 Tax=Tanacetum cinerariifolium TaxID=118510 RepID=A0A699I5R7_TANCI|nr:hypothetical protein [Tanacetum cinerariifolium]